MQKLMIDAPHVQPEAFTLPDSWKESASSLQAVEKLEAHTEKIESLEREILEAEADWNTLNQQVEELLDRKAAGQNRKEKLEQLSLQREQVSATIRKLRGFLLLANEELPALKEKMEREQRKAKAECKQKTYELEISLTEQQIEHARKLLELEDYREQLYRFAKACDFPLPTWGNFGAFKAAIKGTCVDASEFLKVLEKQKSVK